MGRWKSTGLWEGYFPAFPQGYPQSKGSFIISILPLLTEGLFTCQTDRRRRCFCAGFHKHTFFKVLSLVLTSGVAILLYCIFPKCHTIDFLRYDIISRISDFFCCSTISSQRYDPWSLLVGIYSRNLSARQNGTGVIHGKFPLCPFRSTCKNLCQALIFVSLNRKNITSTPHATVLWRV